MKILAMSGFIPEQICDTIRFRGYAGDKNIAHYCSYASDFISQAIQDNSIGGVVFPRTCDSSRIMKSYLGNLDKFIYQVSIPSRQDELAVEFLGKEIENYKKAIEIYYGVKIDDIEQRIDMLNKRNKAIYQGYQDLERISYSEYIKYIHNMLNMPLKEQKFENHLASKSQSMGKRVYIVGSFLTNEELVEIMEESGLNVVGDNLPESGRLAYSPAINSNGHIYENIARSILNTRLSPSQNNFSQLLQFDLNEIENKKVQGVIFITQKYCEPYDYLYSVYKNALNAKGIPLLKVSLADSAELRNAKLSIEAFADMI